MLGFSGIMKQVPAMVEFTEDTDGPPLASRASEQLRHAVGLRILAWLNAR